MNLKILIFISVTGPILFLIIGVVLCAESFKNNYALINYFTSLPLITNQTPPNKNYYISQSSDSDFITIPIHVSNDRIKNKKIYLLHNMFGYQINAHLLISNTQVNQINLTHNINLSEIEPVKRRPLSWNSKIGSAFEKEQIAKNVFNVYCPFPTEITHIKEIDSHCRYNHFPMILDGNYSILELFAPIKYLEFDQIQIQFNLSYLIPYNFIETPEAYIIFISHSSKNLLFYFGVVLLIIGAIFSVGFSVTLIFMALNR